MLVAIMYARDSLFDEKWNNLKIKNIFVARNLRKFFVIKIKLFVTEYSCIQLNWSCTNKKFEVCEQFLLNLANDNFLIWVFSLNIISTTWNSLLHVPNIHFIWYASEQVCFMSRLKFSRKQNICNCRVKCN